MTYPSRPNLLKSTSYLLCLLMLSACGNDIETSYVDNGTDTGSITLPRALLRASTTVKNNLNVFLTVNGGERVEMSVNGDIATATVDQPSGSATYQVDVEYQSDASSAAVPIVTASKSSSSGTVNFTEADFVFQHSDTDTYTNLREVEAGSDPSSSDSRPGNDNFEENETFATAYDLTAFDGVDLLAPGTLFDNADSFGLNFNYASAGYLSAGSGNTDPDIDVFSVTVDESVPRMAIIAKFFTFSDQALSSDTQTTLLDNMSGVNFGLYYPDSSSSEGYSQFFITPSSDTCEIQSDHGVRYFRCVITHTFNAAFQQGVIYPYLLMLNAATNDVEYSFSWFTE